MPKKAIKVKKQKALSRQCGIRKWWESKSKLFWLKKVDESSLMSFIIILKVYLIIYRLFQKKFECMQWIWKMITKLSEFRKLYS